jgi:hypothetical protein
VRTGPLPRCRYCCCRLLDFRRGIAAQRVPTAIVRSAAQRYPPDRRHSGSNDEMNWTCWIGLCRCDPGYSRESGSTRGQMQKSTTRKFCCVHPDRIEQRCPDWTTLRSAAFRYHRRGLNSALAMLANAHKSLLCAVGSCRRIHPLPVSLIGAGDGLANPDMVAQTG